MTTHPRTLVLLAGLLLVLTACASTPVQFSPGPATLEAGPVRDFDDYIDQTRQVVDQNLAGVQGFKREQQVAWNLPFRKAPADNCPAEGSTGVLLVHGLSDSPFVFRDLANRLASECIEVRTLLLQGHGTRPGDMVRTDADVWRAQVEAHFAALAGDVDHAWIGGFSLGGGLATDYALSGQQPQPTGLITLAPAWRLNGLSNYLWLAPIADAFADFVEQEPELNPVKYESFAYNAGTQIARVLSRTQQRVESRDTIDLPLFLVATEADSVINLPYLIDQFRNRFTEPGNRMLVFRDMRNPWPAAGQDPRIESFNSYQPEARILEFSHQSLAIAPDNELYGLKGPLNRCLEPNNLTLEQCRALEPDQLWFSAWHDTPRPVYTSRLTYNPWFDPMADAMVRFIHTTNGAKSSKLGYTE
jgi:esterase/lipase